MPGIESRCFTVLSVVLAVKQDPMAPIPKLRRVSIRSLFTVAFLIVATFGTAQSSGAQANVVISQIYGGGGTAGSTYRNDFVELFNRSGGTVSLTGASLQYASTTGVFSNSVPLSGSIPAGGYYLVKLGAGGGGTIDLPVADATGSFDIDENSGVVALVAGTSSLSSCTAANVVDLVGYGSSFLCKEGLATPALTNTTAAFRKGGGCQDADFNWLDFLNGSPDPLTSSAPLNPCSSPAGPCAYSISPTGATGSAPGGLGAIAVKAPTGCAWTATSNATFVTIFSGSSGSGSGTVGYQVLANASTNTRTGTLTVAGETFTVGQAGVADPPPSCTYSVSPTGAAGSAAGGVGTITVTTPTGCPWTASSNSSFVGIISGSSGSGSGTAGYQVLVNPSTSARFGTLTVAGQTFTVNQAGAVADTAAPFGTVDTPLNNSTGLDGSIAVTGWALDDVGVSAVRVMRDPVGAEAAGQKVFIGTAVLVNGARPDVAAQYLTYPNNTRAGWGYLLLTNMLPNRGNGVFTLSMYADDAAGHETLLGNRTITCSNSTATTPFGAIDTPGQGETVSGTVNNFGWVLSPGARRADPPGGGNVNVFIDGAPVGIPAGWTSRSDISALFPVAQYSGIGTALAVLSFNSAALTNGVHTIAWGVTDSVGGAAGIGSRYFTVSNGAGVRQAAALARLTNGPVELAGRRGPDLGRPFASLEKQRDGTLSFNAEELERIELRVGANGGHLKSALGDLPLPVGSRIDPADGTFTWQPGPGFIGPYALVFDTATGQQTINVTLYPQGMFSRPQVVIDTPSTEDEISGPFTVAGWALDPTAREGTGIDTIHVWAYPLDGSAPVFLGEATLGGKRTDVAALYGSQFRASGYGVVVDTLPQGTYDLAVFAFSKGAGRFLPAVVRRVEIR